MGEQEPRQESSLDLTLLRLLRTKDRYDLYNRSVPKEILEQG